MKHRGFTLIEVLVALFVVALGVGALLTTLISSANALNYMRDKSLAQWIAFNRVSEVRLASSRPNPGVTRDTLEYANTVWRWEQEVTDPGIEGLLRVDVRVARIGPVGSVTITTASEGGEELAITGQAIGFIGTSMARPNGLIPEWSARAPAAPGSGAGGGGAGGGGGGEAGGGGGEAGESTP
jgi:general secretion pathway protein I